MEPSVFVSVSMSVSVSVSLRLYVRVCRNSEGADVFVGVCGVFTIPSPLLYNFQREQFSRKIVRRIVEIVRKIVEIVTGIVEIVRRIVEIVTGIVEIVRRIVEIVRRIVEINSKGLVEINSRRIVASSRLYNSQGVDVFVVCLQFLSFVSTILLEN